MFRWEWLQIGLSFYALPEYVQSCATNYAAAKCSRKVVQVTSRIVSDLMTAIASENFEIASISKHCRREADQSQ